MGNYDKPPLKRLPESQLSFFFRGMVWVLKCHSQRITKDRCSLMEGDPVFLEVFLSLLWVPFKSHFDYYYTRTGGYRTNSAQFISGRTESSPARRTGRRIRESLNGMNQIFFRVRCSVLFAHKSCFSCSIEISQSRRI